MRNSGNKILWQNIFEYSVNAKKAKKEEYILDKLKANQISDTDHPHSKLDSVPR